MPDTANTLVYAQFRTLRDYLGTVGVDVTEICRHTGLPATDPSDPDARVPIPAMREAWRLAYELSGDPALALRVGAFRSVPTLGLLGSLTGHAETVHDSLRHACRYLALISTGIRFQLVAEPRQTALTLESLSEPGDFWPSVVERVFASVVSVLNAQATSRVIPQRAELAFPARPYADVYHELLAPTCNFAATRNALVFSTATLAIPMHGRHPRLCQLLDAEARHALGVLDGSISLASRITVVLPGLLDRDEASARETARAFGLSERTLHRRLAAEGTTLQNLIDAVRRERCLRLMAERRLAIEQIAFACGFSETSGFFRAFKRWTGTTPSAHRRTPGFSRALPAQ